MWIKGVRYLYYIFGYSIIRCMPRIPRVDVGGEFYHVINRANARLPIFFVEEDFQLFENIMEEAQEKFKIDILA